MIESSDAEQVKSNYLENLENLVRIIGEKNEERSNKLFPSPIKVSEKLSQDATSPKISIFVDNQKIYVGRTSHRHLQQIYPCISEELVDKLNKAIFNPQSLEGKVLIKIEKREFFIVENGVVIKDELGLSQPQDELQESESQEKTPTVERTSPESESQEKTPTVERTSPESELQEKTPTVERTSMIESSDAEKVENNYLETLENLIKIIYTQAKKIKAKPSNQISIKVDNENIYKGVIKEENLEKINPFVSKGLVEKLNQAIFNPKELKGVVKIKIGREEVFHVKNGVVVKDKLGLSSAQSQSQTQENESQENTPIVERTSPESESQENTPIAERTYSVEQLQKQVDVLQKKVQEQQELVESLKSGQLSEESIAQLTQQINELFKSLEKQQKLIEKTQQALAKVNRSLPPIKNTKLQNFVGGIEKGVKQIAQGLFKSLKDSVMSRVNHTKQQMNGMKSQVKDKVDNWKSKTHQWIENAKGKAIEKSVRALLRILGKSNSDGSVSFKSRSFNFEQQGEDIIVRAENGEPVLHNGALSPDVSEQHLEAFKKVDVVVEQHRRLEQNARQESASLGKGMRR